MPKTILPFKVTMAQSKHTHFAAQYWFKFISIRFYFAKKKKESKINIQIPVSSPTRDLSLHMIT